jgi:hypothetical protein
MAWMRISTSRSRATRCHAPFYAAWATPVIHPCSLCINARCQVLDANGAVIAGLCCGGESAGGLSLHGLPRAICEGLIAGREAASPRL